MNAFDRYEKGEGRTLVFLHGSGFNRAMWRLQIDSLKNDYSLLVLDLPGHGMLENTVFTLDSAVSHVADVISSETTGKVVTVGLSLGGYVAIAHAAKHPDQIAGLIVSGSSVQYFGLIGLIAKANVALANVVSTSRFVKMQKNMLHGILPDILVEEIASAGFSLKGGRDSMSEMIGKDFLSMLRKYTGTVLILNGENDKLNRKYETRLASAARHSIVETIPNSGHLCNLEQPEAFSNAVQLFAKAAYSQAGPNSTFERDAPKAARPSI